MAKQYKVIAPMVYLRYHDLTGSVVQAAFYEGAVVNEVENEKDPTPGQVTKQSIEHHLGTEQIAAADDPVAKATGPAGTPTEAKEVAAKEKSEKSDK